MTCNAPSCSISHLQGPFDRCEPEIFLNGMQLSADDHGLLTGPTLSAGALSADAWLLFASRFVRLFAYGFLSVVLALYLAELGFSGARIGLLLALRKLGSLAGACLSRR